MQTQDTCSYGTRWVLSLMYLPARHRVQKPDCME